MKNGWDSWLQRPSQQKSTKRLSWEHHFSKKNRIFGRFWGARRDPEISKNQWEGFGKGVLGAIWEPSGSHVGRLVAFFPIVTSFWECLGSLWARFSINFSRFFHHREVGETARQQGSKTTGRQGVWQCSSTIADPRTQYGTSYHLRQCRSTILRQRPSGMREAIE